MKIFEPRPVFYISAITIAHQGHANIYYVHTNAGTSMYYSFDDLPRLAQNFIEKNARFASDETPYTTVISDGGVSCA